MANIRAVDLNLLVIFDALLDELSVTHAAERLNLSQPAVSHALGRIRALFNDPLFVRVQRGLIATPRALELKAPVRSFVAEAEAIVRPQSFDPALATATVHVSTTDYMQLALLLPLITLLRSEAPGISLVLRSLEFLDMRERMNTGEVDMAITTPEFANPELRSRLLYHERYVCAVRAGHPLRATARDLDAFCSYDHIVVSPAGGSPAGPVDEALRKIGRSRRIAVSAPNFLILPRLLAGTDLVAVVPERLVRNWSNELACFPTPIEVPGFDVIAAWHPRVHAEAVHKWFRGRLSDLAQTI